jgi:hypothetical protein
MAAAGVIAQLQGVSIQWDGIGHDKQRRFQQPPLPPHNSFFTQQQHQPPTFCTTWNLSAVTKLENIGYFKHSSQFFWPFFCTFYLTLLHLSPLKFHWVEEC